jgi:hypothetical protein
MLQCTKISFSDAGRAGKLRQGGIVRDAAFLGRFLPKLGGSHGDAAIFLGCGTFTRCHASALFTMPQPARATYV